MQKITPEPCQLSRQILVTKLNRIKVWTSTLVHSNPFCLTVISSVSTTGQYLPWFVPKENTDKAILGFGDVKRKKEIDETGRLFSYKDIRHNTLATQHSSVS